MRLVLVVLVVATILLAAGCFGTPTGPETATPTAPSGDGTGTDTSHTGGTNTATQSGGSPPGVGADGSVDGAVLEREHYRALQGSSFRLDVSEDGGPDPRTFTLYNGSEATRIAFGPSGDGGTFYIAGQVVTVLDDERSPTKTYSFGTTDQGSIAGATHLSLVGTYPGRYLRVGTFERDGTVVRDGETLTRLSATGVNETALAERESTTTDGNLTDMSGTVLVRSDGLVREMSLQQTFDTGETASLNVTLGRLGTTSVGEPGWIDEAPRLEGSFSANGTVLELAHTGGPELPAGTTLTIDFGELRAGLPPSNATLEEPVFPGDSVSVYATGTVLDPAVEVRADSAPAPVGAMNLSRWNTQASGTVGDVRFVIGVPQDDG